MSNRLKAGACAAVLLTVVACAPTSEESLRTEPSRTKTFTTSLDYESVYKNELRGFLACLTGSYFQFTFGVQPKIDRASRTASIVYVEYGGVPAYWALVDIRGTDQGSTVTANAASHRFMKDFPNIAQLWAEGPTQCPESVPVTNHFPLSD